VEGLTHILFTAHNGIVFDIILSLFNAQHMEDIKDLETQMTDNQDIHLNDMKVKLEIENANYVKKVQRKYRELQK